MQNQTNRRASGRAIIRRRRGPRAGKTKGSRPLINLKDPYFLYKRIIHGGQNAQLVQRDQETHGDKDEPSLAGTVMSIGNIRVNRAHLHDPAV